MFRPEGPAAISRGRKPPESGERRKEPRRGERKRAKMAYVNLAYHVVFATKNRQRWLCNPARERIHAYLGGIVHQLGGQSVRVNGPEDHVHLAVKLPASLAVADFTRLLKTNSSKWIHEKLPDMRDFHWQDSYAAFSVSESVLPEVVAYIADQEAHHRSVSFEEELAAFLKKHGIEYDPKYI